MTTIHLPSLFHTIPSEAYSHCAFTGKVLRFSKMMLPLGYRVLEYGWEGSESPAEHVVLGTKKTLDRLVPKVDKNTHLGASAKLGDGLWKRFHSSLVKALRDRVRQGDIIAHPFGRAHQELVTLFPQAHHIETGIGYPDKPFGAWRIWESEAWRHWHWGNEGRQFPGSDFPNSENRPFSWVIPNYYDPADWPLGDGSGDYVLFMGRFIPEKGLHVIRDIITAWHLRAQLPPIKFVFAGVGDWDAWIQEIPEPLRGQCEYRGPVIGKARAELCGLARCMLMPTQFLEPFGGSGIESMMTGTPLIASDWGAFTETVVSGANGYRCKIIGDWVEAIKRAPQLNRHMISTVAQNTYSLERCGKLYDLAFKQVCSLRARDWNKNGWNSLTPVAEDLQ